MSKDNNATCAICGTPYEVCRTCQEITSFKPWRTITDTVECYKIYMVIHQYITKTIDKNTAKELLSDHSLPKTLQPNIQKAIDEIMQEDKIIAETESSTEELIFASDVEVVPAVQKITYQKGKSNFKHKKRNNEQ